MTPARARALASACSLLVLFPRPAVAGDPALVWRTLTTPHFEITYHVDVERLARRLAVVAEEVHDRVVPFFDHQVKHRTRVLVADTSDDANGSATVLPYPTTHLFVTAPDDRSELNDYDDWLYALFLHEYTHVVHLDTIHGVARVINAILGFGEWGQLYAPNQSQPRFIIEGLAVYEETHRSSGGRLRSSIYDMYLRTATLAGKFQRLDQFTASPIQWPRGGSPYLYGSAFMRYIASLYGPDVFRRLAHEYGASWLPGGINRALRAVTGGKSRGQTFETLYGGFRASMVERYRGQLAMVQATGPREGRPLTGWRDYAARPIFTRDGQSIVWADSSGFDRARFRVIPRAGGRARTLHLVDGAGGSAFSPDGRTLYFSAAQGHRTVYLFNDLFALDVATGDKRQLTHGLRAENPDLSPDGRTLAFSVNQAGSRSLCLMPAAGGEVTWLIGNRDDLSQIYTPAWSPDGRHLAFSWWREGGYRDLYTVDVATREVTRITADRALDLEPRYSPDGRYIYFSSDRTGIYNLYAYEVDGGRTWQVTNVIGGAFDVAIAPDGRTAAFVGFVADGWNLQALDLDPATWRPAAGALIDRPEANVPRGLSTLPARSYQPWRTMGPLTLQLSSYPDAFGQVLQVGLAGADIAGTQSWNLNAGFGTGRADDIAISASYAYNRYFPSLGLSGYRLLTRRGGFLVDGINRPYIEEDWSATASVTLPILRQLARSSDLAFSYNLVYLRNVDRDTLPTNPNLIAPQLPETGRIASLGIGWSWFNGRRFTYSISTEQGRSMGVSLGVSLKGLGSEYEVFTATWRYTEYLAMPWPAPLRNHVLVLSYAGGVSGGELRRRQTFSLGGYGVSVQDIVRSLFDFTRAGAATLRGYAAGSIAGHHYHLLQAEYRFPIAWIERGLGTFPLYLKRLHGVVFADYGHAWSGPIGAVDVADFRLGVGGELRLEMIAFYYLGATIQLGYARGLMAGGIDQVYFLLNNPF